MPARSQAMLVLALLVALVVPSAALAQSAGDEQYSDPFGEEQQQEQQPASGQTETPAEPLEQAEQVPTPTEGSGEEAAAAPAQSSDPSLPVTGLPALTLLALGAGMLAAGLLVRRRA